MSRRTRTVLASITVWNLACLALMFVYRDGPGRLVVATYSAWYGDIQADYGSFARLGTYLGFAVVTSPATLVSLWLFDRLSRRAVGWTRVAFTFLGWQLVVVAILIWSYEVGLPYKINQLGWALFGPPEDVYSFQNLVLHRIIAWLVCTTPVAWIALWWHSQLSRTDSAGRGPQKAGT